MDSSWGVFGQRFNTEGVAVGNEFQINTTTGNKQWRPEASGLADGGFVVVWNSQDQDGSDIGVFGQRFNADGEAVGDEFQVNTTTDNRQYRPTVSGLADGGFVVAWEGQGSDGNNGIYSQHFDATGASTGVEVRVGDGGGQRPVVTELTDGDYVIVWQNGDNNDWGVYGQRYNADGTASGTQFLINSTTNSSQQHPEVTALADGGFVVAWQSNNQDGSGWGIYGQRFDADGFTVGDEFMVNTSTQNSQEYPRVAALSDGGFVITWQGNEENSNYSLYGQLFDSAGQRQGEQFEIADTGTSDSRVGRAHVEGLSDGSVVVVWHQQDNSGYGIYQQRFVSGTQIVDGDRIIGGATDDILVGGAGDQTLVGGAGDDAVDGGAGINIYEVSGTPDSFYFQADVTGSVILKDLVVGGDDLENSSDEGTDSLRNIQIIRFISPEDGSQIDVSIDDHGNAPDAGNTVLPYGEIISGRINFKGDTDVFFVDAAAGEKVILESLIGGNGGLAIESVGLNSHFYNNGQTIEYTQNTDGLVDLALTHTNENPGNSYSPAGSQSYSIILRRVQDGTSAGETLSAGNNYEWLRGQGGDDLLLGSARRDVLEGGDGNDVMTGGAGNDRIDGGTGDANVAIFTGNRSDYAISWGNNWNGSQGQDLSLRITDGVADRDGADELRNVQVLRFADGDVVLDAEGNQPNTDGYTIGEAIKGSLPITDDWQQVDRDYFQQVFTPDVTVDTAIRISFESLAPQNTDGYINFEFRAIGSSDRLRFTDLDNPDNSYTTFQVGPGQTRSFIVSIDEFSSTAPFVAAYQRLDVLVSGVARGYQGEVVLGQTAEYSIRVDLVLYGDDTSEVIEGDPKYTYIDARGGDDVVTGSEASEELVGGAGDDVLDGGAGDDVLTDAQGTNTLSGGAGDDVINLTGTSAPQGVVDGGEGTDTLRVASDTNFSNLSISNVEILDGRGGRTQLTPQEVVDRGFTTANNITFSLDPNGTGGTLDASGLAGNFTLRGSNQSDHLIGNADANTLYLHGEDNYQGSGRGVDTVESGAGDDSIVWRIQRYESWERTFSDADEASRTYFVDGAFDGGVGKDTFTFDFRESYFYHAWGGNTWNQSESPSWHLDLSRATWSGVEALEFTNQDAGRPWAHPSSVVLSVAQVAGLTSTSGLPPVVLVGGGTIDLAHLSAIGISSWSIGDEGIYDIVGTDAGDSLTLTSGTATVNTGVGSDSIKIVGKAEITDVIDGGAGNDTLVIQGGDVDLSGATITGIERIKLNVDSLSMTDVQWDALGGLIELPSSVTPNYLLTLAAPGTFVMDEASSYAGVYGSAGDDALTGNALDNRLDGRAGDDVLMGGAGADRLLSGAGFDSLSGEAGDDVLVVTGKSQVTDTLSGGEGSDTLIVEDGQDLTGASISGLEVLAGSGTVTLTQSQTLSFDALGSVSIVMVVAGVSTDYTIQKDVSGSIGLSRIDGSEDLVLPEQVVEVRFSDKSYLVESVFTGLGESRVNTGTDRNQDRGVVTGLEDGGYVVVWQSHNENYQYREILGQRYDAQGNTVGAEFLINSEALSEKSEPAVTGLVGGGFVVTWMSNGQDGSEWGVYGQRFDVDGEAVGDEFKANTYNEQAQGNPEVTALADGGFVITWQSWEQDGYWHGVYAQRFNTEGEPVGNEFQVNNFTSRNQEAPAIITLVNGDFIITWMSEDQDSSEWGIYAQRYNDSGAKIGPETLINATTTSNQYNPAITALADGGYVVVWMDNGQDGSGWGIYGQRFDAAGFRAGDELQINTATQGQQQDPAVTALADGGFVATWMSDSQDGSGWGIYGQRFDENGDTLGTEFLVNRLTSNDQQDPAISALADGSFVVTWQSSDDWGNGIYHQRFATDRQIVDGDRVIGGASDDILVGGAGNQTLFGGSGNDFGDGGAGINIYEVSGTPDGFYAQVNRVGDYVLTDLVVGGDDPANAADEGQDALRNIQVIRYISPEDGSVVDIEIDDHGNAPDAGNTVLSYGEIISGRINFKGDTDYFFIDSTKGVEVIFESLIGNNGLAINSAGLGNHHLWNDGETRDYTQNTDGLVDLALTHAQENPSGSNSAQSSQAYSIVLRRVLEGTGDADTLEAGGGYEWLRGFEGDDTLVGSDRLDVLEGGDGNDVLTGGAGNDRIDGGTGDANVAIFTGNRSDYTIAWGNNWNGGYQDLSLRITDGVADRDGADQLRNVQILRFADGDVVLDAEGNQPNTDGYYLGESIEGSLPVTDNYNETDVDYFQWVIRL